MRELRFLSAREFKTHTIHFLASLPLLRDIVSFVNNYNNLMIIVPSHGIKDSLLQAGVHTHKVLVAPLFFDRKLVSFAPCKVKPIEHCKDTFVVTYFGSPLSVRGTDTLLKAFRDLINQRYDNLKLILLLRVESDTERKEACRLYKMAKRLGIERNVSFITHTLSREELDFYLKNSSIIALPFKIVQSEPPLTILESLAIGKPLITTTTCGLPSIVPSRCALFSRPAQHNSLAECIRLLTENWSLSRKLSKNAKTFISKLPEPTVFTLFIEDVLLRYTCE